MSKKALQLGFCLLAFTALSTFPAQAVEGFKAVEDFNYGYTKSGVGGTMEQACNNAIQNLKDACGIIAPPTTDPGRCWPLENAQGQIVDYICTCEATTVTCLKLQAQ